jgi:hypothetical protein
MNILILLVFGLLFLAGLFAGYLLASSKSDSGLSRAERKELNAQRNLIGDLTSMAGEHAMLGDAFAVLAQIKINDYRKELNR